MSDQAEPSPLPAAPCAANIPAPSPAGAELPAAMEVKPDPPARKIAVLGEIPFAGRALVCALLARHLKPRVLCPDEDSERAIRAAGGEAACEIVRGTLESPDAIAAVMEGAYGAVFLSPVGLHGRLYRAPTHLEDVRRVVAAARNTSLRK